MIMKLNQISLRYLKGQKKHTLMTIIAVTLGTAFLTVLLCAVSVYRATALNSAIKTNGTYHVLFNGLTKQQLLEIRNLDIFEETENYSVSAYSSALDMDFVQMHEADGTVEFLVREGNLVDDNFYRMDQEKITMLPDEMHTVTEGRMPEADGEIVISAQSAFMWGYPQVGDTVTAQLVTCKAKDGNISGFEESVPPVLAETFDIASAEEISFKVVGLSDKYNFVDYSDTRLRSYSYLYDNLLARFSDKAYDLYWDMNYAFADLGLEIDDFDYSMNQELLDMEGKGVAAKFSEALFFALMYLAVIFIMFCVRMVIDNAFEISAKERIKQFGLLKAAGASRKQVLALTLWEAFYLAVPGVVPGIALGAGLARVAFEGLKANLSAGSAMQYYDLSSLLEFKLEPYVFISAAVIGLLWVCISAVATGMRMIKASPVEAMRSAGKKEKISVPKKPRKSKGNFIADYSALSIKRNKKRYLITMISLVMSITLFTIFTYGIGAARQVLSDRYDSTGFSSAYTVNYQAFSPYSVSDEIAKMKESGYFTNVGYDAEIVLYGTVDEFSVPEDSQLYSKGNLVMRVHPINKENFEKSVTSDIDYDTFVSSQCILINNEMVSPTGEAPYSAYGNTSGISVHARPFNSELMEFFDYVDVIVTGSFTTENDLYISNGYISAIVAEENYLSLMEFCGMDNSTYEYTDENGDTYYVYVRTITADPAEGRETEAENYLNMHYYGSFTNAVSDSSRAYADLEAVRFIGYFAIVIVSLIAAVNIVNIISANVLGRTSELAMLRACGMSDKQLHRLVFREGMIYAGTAGIVSLLLTEAMILVLRLPFILGIADLSFLDIGFEPSFTAPIPYVLAASAAAFVIAAAASWFPAQRVINSSIVDSMAEVN